MKHSFLCVIFNTEIINHQGKCDSVGDMCKEAGDMIMLDISVHREMGD